jgi:TPR repeat protein
MRSLYRPTRLFLAALLIILTLAGIGAARAQQGYGGGTGGTGGGVGGAPGGGGGQASQAPSVGASKPVDDIYTRAMKLKQKGQYSEAMPLLEAMSIQGHGYEVAQLELGRCYLDLARRATDPVVATHQQVLGYAWILAAANAGFGLAEQEIVRLYLDGGGVPIDRVEAGKWYLLWRHNPSRMQIGSNQFDVGLETRLKAGLKAAEWVDAQKRADQWRPS